MCVCFPDVQVETSFLPSVYDRVSASLVKVEVAGRLVDNLLASSVARAEDVRVKEVERVRVAREAEEKRRREAEEAARLKASLGLGWTLCGRRLLVSAVMCVRAMCPGGIFACGCAFDGARVCGCVSRHECARVVVV